MIKNNTDNSLKNSLLTKRNSSELVKRQLFKTKMCAFHSIGKCTRGQKCAFAHTIQELRPIPDLRFTKLCEIMRNGETCNNINCNFAHCSSDLRITQLPNISSCISEKFIDLESQIVTISNNHFVNSCISNSVHNIPLEESVEKRYLLNDNYVKRKINPNLENKNTTFTRDILLNNILSNDHIETSDFSDYSNTAIWSPISSVNTKLLTNVDNLAEINDLNFFADDCLTNSFTNEKMDLIGKKLNYVSFQPKHIAQFENKFLYDQNKNQESPPYWSFGSSNTFNDIPREILEIIDYGLFENHTNSLN